MKQLFARIIDRSASDPPKEVRHHQPKPEQDFLAIGDVHGRADLLLELDQLIETNRPGLPVVFVGDYVDRGEQSREVLELLTSVAPDGDPPVTCLMGNHERMLLDFLDDPSQSARRWLKNGGLQTLASYGVAPPRGGGDDPAALEALRDRLAEKMGAEVIDWLRARPLTWRSGDVWVIHAGADPSIPMDTQASRVLLWGHDSFLRAPRPDGQWVVHGHTVVDTPCMTEGRIAVDTGAYATGRLTAAAITRDGVTFLQTGRG
jgi:serine/threonine protein phosphatase 1